MCPIVFYLETFPKYPDKKTHSEEFGSVQLPNILCTYQSGIFF
jgi:hypothetical protein